MTVLASSSGKVSKAWQFACSWISLKQIWNRHIQMFQIVIISPETSYLRSISRQQDEENEILELPYLKVLTINFWRGLTKKPQIVFYFLLAQIIDCYGWSWLNQRNNMFHIPTNKFIYLNIHVFTKTWQIDVNIFRKTQ